MLPLTGLTVLTCLFGPVHMDGGAELASGPVSFRIEFDLDSGQGWLVHDDGQALAATVVEAANGSIDVFATASEQDAWLVTTMFGGGPAVMSLHVGAGADLSQFSATGTCQIAPQ